MVKKKKKKSFDIKQKQEPMKKIVSNKKGSGAPCLYNLKYICNNNKTTTYKTHKINFIETTKKSEHI